MTKRLDTEYIRKRFEEKGYKLLTKEYKNNSQRLSVIDDEGYKYQIHYNRFAYMDDKPLTKFHYGNVYTPENIQLYFNKNNIKLSILDKTPRKIKVKTDKIEFVCNCGNIFKSTFQNIYYNKTKRCRRCSLSKSELERIVSEYLDEINVRYIEQYTFKDCKIKKLCRFDFYLVDYNIIIEVNGSQHYYKNSDFNMSLEEQKIRDEYKKDYCKKNGIKYLEIPFWDIKNNSETYKKKINKILN